MENSLISNWTVSSLNLGEVKVGKTLHITFTRLTSSPIIKNVIASCNCIVAEARDLSIEIQFKPKPIPKHLSFQGYYQVTKHINVIYEDATTDELAFSATIVK